MDLSTDIKRWATGFSFFVLTGALIWATMPIIPLLVGVVIMASQLWLSWVVATAAHPLSSLPDQKRMRQIMRAQTREISAGSDTYTGPDYEDGNPKH